MTAPIDKLPPHSAEAEQGILGCCLIDPGCLDTCCAKLAGSEAFYSLNNRAVYEGCLGLRQSGRPIDTITLSQALRDAGQLDKIGGLSFLSGLPEAVPSAANLDHYLDIVHGKYLQRQAIQAAYEVLEASEQGNITTVAAVAAKSFESIAHASATGNGAFTIRKPDELLAMKFDNSDNILGDRLLAKGQSLVIAGAGGLGKSRLALQLAVASITGKAFLDFETHGPSGRWLFLQVENSNRRLNYDLGKLKQWAGDKWPLVNENLFIHTLEGDLDSFVPLDKPDVVRNIGKVIGEINPAVIVWDSLYNFSVSGDLNKDEIMLATLMIISRLPKTQIGAVGGTRRTPSGALPGHSGQGARGYDQNDDRHRPRFGGMERRARRKAGQCRNFKPSHRRRRRLNLLPIPEIFGSLMQWADHSLSLGGTPRTLTSNHAKPFSRSV